MIAFATLYKFMVMQIKLVIVVVVVVVAVVIVNLFILTAMPQHQRWNRCRILTFPVHQNWF